MVPTNLKESRENLYLKQRDIAKFLNVHYSTVSGWETGKDTIPLKHLIAYANQYEYSLDYLFGLVSQSERYFPIDVDLFSLAHNLTVLRLKNNFTQTAVAKKLNTTQPAYSHYETASNLIPTNFLFGLTKIYAPFSIDELFNRKKKTKEDYTL